MMFDPAAMSTYCRPSTMYVIGDACQLWFVLKCQSGLPDCASTAAKSPASSHWNTKPPAVDNTPRHPPELQKAIALSAGNKMFKATLAHTYAMSGTKDDAANILSDLTNRSNRGFSNASEIALVYVGWAIMTRP
jgi:hypothetical protein